MKTKNILLGVTGSISAYKACDIISGLKASDFNVKVVMTESAKMFIPEMTLAVLSKNEVCSSFETDVDGNVKHIDLANWADLILIAPATANTIAKIANGIADNVLTAVVLAFEKPVIIAPAMNTIMFYNNITTRNIDNFMKEKNNYLIQPKEGLLACGAYGCGKLEKPRKIVEIVNGIYKQNKEI